MSITYFESKLYLISYDLYYISVSFILLIKSIWANFCL